MTASAERIRVDVFLWRRTFMSKNGPHATTRAVLNGLALHMEKAGDSCFPSTKLLEEETGLSERTVCTHLEIADRDGWIERSEYGLPGQKWGRMQYKATIPRPVLDQLSGGEEREQKELFEDRPGGAGTERGSAPRAEGTERDSAASGQGTEPLSIKALKEVQSRSSGNSPGTSRSPGNGSSTPESSVANATGAVRRVENSTGGTANPPAAAPPARSDWTNGQLMGLVRDNLYTPDRKAPAGYDDGRDMGIIQDLQQYARYSRSRIANAIQGLAMLRDAGQLCDASGAALPRGTKLTMRYLYHTELGVRDLFGVAEDTYLASLAAPRPVVPARAKGFTPVGAALAATLPRFTIEDLEGR